jgi:hypothetical protein
MAYICLLRSNFTINSFVSKRFGHSRQSLIPLPLQKHSQYTYAKELYRLSDHGAEAVKKIQLGSEGETRIFTAI